MVKPASASRSLSGRITRGPFHSEPPTGIDPVTSFLPRTRSTTELGGQRVRTLPAIFGTVKSMGTFVSDDTKVPEYWPTECRIQPWAVTRIISVASEPGGARNFVAAGFGVLPVVSAAYGDQAHRGRSRPLLVFLRRAPGASLPRSAPEFAEAARDTTSQRRDASSAP